MENTTEIGIMIAFGCLATFTLAMLIILLSVSYRRKILQKENVIQALENERQIALFKTAAEAEERQKEEIARNLHDQLIPPLVTIGLNIEKSGADLRKNTLKPEHLNKQVEAIEQVIEGVRVIAHDLIPKTLLAFGLIHALEKYIKQVNGVESSVTDIVNQTSFDNDLPFSKPDQLNIYRICLEILNNLYKHSRYTYLKVILKSEPSNFLIEFRHNGKGITNSEIELFSESKIGLGLKSVKARLLLLNARIDYRKEKQSSSIHLSFPVGDKVKMTAIAP